MFFQCWRVKREDMSRVQGYKGTRKGKSAEDQKMGKESYREDSSQCAFSAFHLKRAAFARMEAGDE